MIEKVFVEQAGQLVAQVTFRLPANLHADRIYLVGDFNDWAHTTHPFERNSEGEWIFTLELEPGRAYQFRYLTDGVHWMNDTAADAYVHNRYGSNNFVVVTDAQFKPYTDAPN